jgi:hypothetical protein
LVAAIAVDALGSSNVVGVAIPSRYSSPASAADAGLLAQNLDIRLMNIPIEKPFQAYLEILAEAFEGTEPNVTEENIQARIDVGWEKWTPKSGKIERRRCQNERGSARKVDEGVSRGSGENGNGREYIVTGGSPSAVLATIDVSDLGEGR